jgi:TetR/AcrR family transcriptional regulator, transcriptional repressor for nem operon
MARPREFNKDDVIERAMLLFKTQGYEATSIRDLKTAMGISTSSMYEVFGDKRGVFLAALARFCEWELARIDQMARDVPRPQRFIRQLFTTVEDAVLTNSQDQRSLAFNTMVEFGTVDAEVTKLLLKHYFAIAEIIADVLARGQRDGTITSKEPPLHLAYTILSALQGVATVKGVQPDFAYVDAVTHVILKLLDS